MNLSVLIAFIFWIVILIFASWLIDHLLAQLISRRLYRIVITPGIIVHELSHTLACILMRAKIMRIRFFAAQGGAVEHQPPRVPIIGRPIIGLAPLVGVTLAIFGLAYYFGYQVATPTVNFSSSFFTNFGILALGVFDIFTLSLGHWQFWLFLYLVVSLSASIAPSTTDLKHAAAGAILVTVVAGILLYFDIGTKVINTTVSKYLGWVVALGAMFEIIALVVIIPIYLIKKLIGREKVL